MKETLRVLLIEDSPSDAALVGVLLSRQRDFELMSEGTLKAGLARVEQDDVDVVLLDLGLPDSRGTSGIQAIRDIAPKAAVVVLTASSERDVGAASIRAGADDFVPKGQLTTPLLSRSIRYACERQRRLLEAEESRENLGRLIDAHMDALVVLDENDLVLFANPAAGELFGQRADDMIGSVFAHAGGVGQTTRIELKHHVPPRVAEMSIGEVRYLGQQARLCSVRDITARERADALQQQLIHADRLASIGQMAAGVAHEVNNPAAFVMTNLTMLQRDFATWREVFGLMHVMVRESIDPALRDEVDTLLSKPSVMHALDGLEDVVQDSIEGVQRIVRLLKQLRGFARQEGPEQRPTALKDVVQGAAALSNHQIKHRARLETTVDDVPMVQGNQAQLEQVLTNLLVNAAQAIEGVGEPEGGHVIRVHVFAMDKQRVVLRVTDTGSGIPSEELPMIFTPFFTTKPAETGTGLGLSLCADIVAQHQGEIRVQSEPGKGTTFEITLPELGASAISTTSQKMPAAPGGPLAPGGPGLPPGSGQARSGAISITARPPGSGANRVAGDTPRARTLPFLGRAPAPPAASLKANRTRAALAPGQASRIGTPDAGVRRTRDRIDAGSATRPTRVPRLASGKARRGSRSGGRPVSRILVVDDEEPILRAMRRLLSHSHEVILADGGREALALIDEHDGQFDALLCDVMMPDVDGTMLYEHLRTHRPSLAKRLVFCTGGVFTPGHKAFMETVDVQVLTKPFTRQDLEDAIAAVLKESGPNRPAPEVRESDTQPTPVAPGSSTY